MSTRHADFFTTEVWTWHGLVTFYTVFVMDLASRRVQILGSTPYPDEAFMCQLVRNCALGEGVSPSRDEDRRRDSRQDATIWSSHSTGAWVVVRLLLEITDPGG
jgi:hypothetical protein